MALILLMEAEPLRSAIEGRREMVNLTKGRGHIIATIDDKSMIDKIIAMDGAVYEDEPPVVKIVEYTNAWGKVTWGVIWRGQRTDMYAPSEYVREPRVIFDRTGYPQHR